jgi:glycosyltransferase involved in cell wall biosynthesis
MEPIRVLQVVTTMDRAGLETMLMNYYRHMDRSRVQFDFLKHREGPHAYDAEIESLGGRIYTVPAFNPLNTNGYLDALGAFFREHPNYKIVHSHLDCLSAVPLEYARRYGTPVRIAHSHVHKMTFDAKYPIRMFYRHRIPAVATDLFACSRSAGEWMFGKHPFRLIANAIDCEAFGFDPVRAEALRREAGLEGQFVMAHVGRFDPVKNHRFLLEVFREVLSRQENAALLLAGTGDTMPQIREMAANYGIAEKVRFLGSVSDIPGLLQLADAFVFPSLYEGLGISLIEAQAAGLSCFAADCVPGDANVTGRVRYLPLSGGAVLWAEEILKAREQPRHRDTGLIRQQGYDIALETEKLQEFYLCKYLEEVSCGDTGCSL